MRSRFDEQLHALGTELIEMGMSVKIIDQSEQRCIQMGERLPGALVIVGDGTDSELLHEEGIEQTDAFVAITGMDEANMRNMARCFGGDPAGKLHLLLGFAGREDSVADPWYTGDFEATWQDVNEGCLALLNRLYPEVQLDFSGCQSREELYALMAERMLWREGYGRNLDALYDILTGLPYYGRSFVVRLPNADSPVYGYAGRIVEVFHETGLPLTVE